jgi:hypothetical protein
VNALGVGGLVLTLLAACTTEDGGGAAQPSASEREDVRLVPGEYETIHAAVDATQPGDLVLLSPGVYHEAVEIETGDLVIRGLDRNEVVRDGGFELKNGIKVFDADGVAIENMTARNYTINGFLWTDAARYRASYLTAYNNGSYGIYAFDSSSGLIDHSYASGNADAGFCIGQCHPCDAVIDDVVGEYNRVGYSGTNAGGNLFIVNSTFRYNRNGIAPKSGSYEENAPERETTIVGNLVYSNNYDDFIRVEVGGAASVYAGGNGILVIGGLDNAIERNRVIDHDATGIAAILFADTILDEAGEPAGTKRWWPSGNVVRDNVVQDSGWPTSRSTTSRARNCFEGNTHTSSAPSNLEDLMPCGGSGSGIVATAPWPLRGWRRWPASSSRTPIRISPSPIPKTACPIQVLWQSAAAPPSIDVDAIGVPDEP